jgi:hypothetical protein
MPEGFFIFGAMPKRKFIFEFLITLAIRFSKYRNPET